MMVPARGSAPTECAGGSDGRIKQEEGMFIRVAELLIVLFFVWLLANVIRAVAFKSSKGGGFWGLYNFMTSKEREAAREAAIEAEVQARLAAKLAEAQKAAEGGQAKQG